MWLQNHQIMETKNTASLCVSLFLPTILSSVSPYYFEKVGVLLRVEFNPGWRLIKAAAPTLALAELRRKTHWRHSAATDAYMLHWMYGLFVWFDRGKMCFCRL